MASCPRCASPDVLAVALQPDNRTMQFHGCRGCEHRWWTVDHVGDILLDDVLAAVGAH